MLLELAAGCYFTLNKYYSIQSSLPRTPLISLNLYIYIIYIPKSQLRLVGEGLTSLAQIDVHVFFFYGLVCLTELHSNILVSCYRRTNGHE